MDLEDLAPSTASETPSSASVETVPASVCSEAAAREQSDVGGARVRVCVRTVGCQHNVSDGEQMAGVLAREGFEVVAAPAAADVVVLNGCVAKTPSQDQFYSQCAQLLLDGRTRVVAAGCAAQTLDKTLAPLRAELAATARRLHPGRALAPAEVDALFRTRFACLGVDQLAAVGDVVRALCAGDAAQPAMRLARTPSGPSLDLVCARQAENPLVVAVAACTGCLNACTYCKTFSARGRLRSQRPEAVVECVVRCVRAGAREVRLTGEDIGAYGLDLGTTLPVLVEALADALARTGTGAMLRIGMANPPYVLSYVDRLAALLQHPNVHSYVHIPVQSGSDFVLAAMKRNYTVADFDRCVAALRAAVPDVTIATDIIVGFPAEQEDDHLATLALLERHRFPFVNINAMFVRPGTAAARMPPLAPQTLRRRVREVSAFFGSYANAFDHLVGRTVPVSVCERAHRPGQWAAHTKQYVQVLLDDSAFSFPGPDLLQSGKPFQCMNVRITSAGKWSVTGVPVD